MTALRVTVQRDPGSALWFLRCAEPCRAACAVCWLGSAFTEAGAIEYARWIGYVVVA